MKIQIGILSLAVFVMPALAADYTLELKPDTTKIAWTLADPLHTVHGTFNLKHGTIDFDPETCKASGQVVVDVTSGDSGSGARDRNMHANVLQSAKYPEAVFVPRSLEGSLAVPGASTLKIHGAFTMHGTTHEMTMDVQTTATGDQIRATITFDIPYVAWGMKDPSNFLLKVDKTVKVSIQTTGSLRRH
jgi:polyisoprenoid-binding protein YceI